MIMEVDDIELIITLTSTQVPYAPSKFTRIFEMVSDGEAF